MKLYNDELDTLLFSSYDGGYRWSLVFNDLELHSYSMEEDENHNLIDEINNKVDFYGNIMCDQLHQIFKGAKTIILCDDGDIEVKTYE